MFPGMRFSARTGGPANYSVCFPSASGSVAARAAALAGAPRELRLSSLEAHILSARRTDGDIPGWLTHKFTSIICAIETRAR
jgi:hypothetical protein